MLDKSHEIVEFSLGDEDYLKDLLQDINSSYSANLSCSFEYNQEIDDDIIFTLEDLKKTHDDRIGIPQEIKQLSQKFVTVLFDEFLNKSEENSPKINNFDFDKINNKNKEINTSEKNLSRNNSSNKDKKYLTNTTTFSQTEKIENNFNFKSDRQVLIDKPFTEVDDQRVFGNASNFVPSPSVVKKNSIPNSNNKLFKIKKENGKYTPISKKYRDDSIFSKESFLLNKSQIKRSNSKFHETINNNNNKKIHFALPLIDPLRPMSARQNTFKDKLKKYLLTKNDENNNKT